jgi:hypothetical protein
MHTDLLRDGYALEMAKAQEIVSEIHSTSSSSNAGLDGIGSAREDPAN